MIRGWAYTMGQFDKTTVKCGVLSCRYARSGATAEARSMADATLRWASILVGAVLSLAAARGVVPGSQEARQLAVAPENGVVLSREAAASVAVTCSRPSPPGLTGYWSPLPSDIVRLESALAAYLEERIAFEQRPRASTVPVFRQYVGMFRSGRKVVYINGFNGDPAPRLPWRTDLLRVCDGGPTNFGLVFDSETGTFSDFQANSWF